MNILRMKVFIIDGNGKPTQFNHLVTSRNIPEAVAMMPKNGYAFCFFETTRNAHGRHRGRFGPADNFSPIYDREGKELCPDTKSEAFLNAQQAAIDQPRDSLRKP